MKLLLPYDVYNRFEYGRRKRCDTNTNGIEIYFRADSWYDWYIIDDYDRSINKGVGPTLELAKKSADIAAIKYGYQILNEKYVSML